MRISSTVVMALMFLFMQSCMVSGDDSSKNQQSNNSNIPTMGAASANADASIAGGQHYVCPNGCEGSGGASEGTCSNCGSAYVHNAAYHMQQQTMTPTAAPPSDPNAISPIFTDRSKGSSATIDNSNAAATAAGGLEHYTCPNGCVGGGGDSSGNCSVCGTELTHNTAFHNQNTSTTTTTTTDLDAPAATTAGGLEHYTCPNGCVGGGAASSGNCSVCGTALTHNTAFHNQNSSSNTIDLQTPSTTTPTTNTSGVSHYICSNGCAGSGSAQSGNCVVCGQALTHNAAYHQ